MFDYETAPYDIVLQDQKFEIRLYKKYLTASVDESVLSSTGGFNQIFNYISGENQEQKKISMTTPVFNELKEETMTTEFVMPSVYTDGALPEPDNKKITIRKYEEQLMASVRFSGSVNQEVIKEYQNKLRDWLQDKEYIAFGSFKLARYNPPFIPPFLRRNEIMIQVKKK